MQSLAERGARPGAEDTPTFSSEQDLASAASRDALAHGNPGSPPEWATSAFERWRQESDGLPPGAREDGGGDNTLEQNPPLYYGYESIAYRVSGGLFGSLYLMRVFSSLLLLIAATGAWLLAGELFGRNRPLQLTTAAAVGLAPMATFISAVVNPDAMLIAATSLALWLGVRIIRRGLNLRDAAALLAVVAIATLAKPTALALLPAAGLAILVAAVRSPRIPNAVVAGAAALVLLVGVPAGALVASKLSEERFAATGPDGREPPALAEIDIGEFGSYLTAFYLPDPVGGQLEDDEGDAIFPLPTIYPLYDVWVKEGIGAFGWLDTYFPNVLYAVIAVLIAIVAVLAARMLLWWRDELDWGVLAFLALAVVGLLAILHLTEYQYLYAHGSKFNEGRYLLPLLPIAGLVASTALLTFSGRRRGTALAAGVGALFVLQVLSLAIAAGRFYA